MTSEKMKAAVLYGKEDVRVETIDIPNLKPGDILVQVKAALTCGTDLKVFRRGYHAAMIKPPSVFGHECAGIITAVGEPQNSHSFQVGDRIVAANSVPCGECPPCDRGQENLCDDLLFLNGAYAEYIRIPCPIVEQNVYKIPNSLEFEDAALVEPLACVVQGLKETPVKVGETVAVLGLGPIGLMFVALLKNQGAKVLAVGRRKARLQAAERLGADIVMNAERFEKGTNVLPGPDLTIEATGQPQVWSKAMHWVRKGGRVNLFGGCEKGTTVPLDTNRLHYDQITLTSSFHHSPEAVREALDHIEKGVIRAKDFVSESKQLDELPELLNSMLTNQPAVKYCIRP